MGRDRDALGCVAGAQAGRPALPEHRAGEEQRLAGPTQAHADELGEKDAKALVEPGRCGHLYGHALSGLP